MKFSVKTRKNKELLDITSIIREKVKNKSGIVNVFVLHTTCSLTTIDDDPGIEDDFFNAISNLLPHVNYTHPHDPNHTPDHILSSLIGPSISIPVEGGELILGTWQKIVLVEFSGPREREIIIKFKEDD